MPFLTMWLVSEEGKYHLTSICHLDCRGACVCCPGELPSFTRRQRQAEVHVAGSLALRLAFHKQTPAYVYTRMFLFPNLK